MPLAPPNKRKNPATDLEDLRIRSGLPRTAPTLAPGTAVVQGDGRTLTEADLPQIRLKQSAAGGNTSMFGEARPGMNVQQNLAFQTAQQDRAIANYEKNILPRLPSSAFQTSTATPVPVSPQDQANWLGGLTKMMNSPTGYSSDQVRQYADRAKQAGVIVPPHIQAQIDIVGSKAETVQDMQLRLRRNKGIANRAEADSDAQQIVGSIDLSTDQSTGRTGAPYFFDTSDPEQLKLKGELSDLIAAGKSSGMRPSAILDTIRDFNKRNIGIFDKNAARAREWEHQAGAAQQRQDNADAEKRNAALAKVAERKLDDIDKRIEQVRKKIEKAEDVDPDTVKKLTEQLEGPGGLVEQHEALLKDWETKMTGQPAQQPPAGQAGQGQPQPTGQPAPSAGTQAPAQVKTKQEYDALPVGATYRDAQGNLRRKT